VKFCPKCGAMMKPRRMGGKLVYVCPNCGYMEEAGATSPLKITRTTPHSEKERIVIIEDEEPKGLPRIKGVRCPRCGHDEAYYWVVQTRAADEPSTRFYKCVKCGYVWREYE